MVSHLRDNESRSLVPVSLVHCRSKFNDALEVIPKEYQKKSIRYLIMKQIQAIYREEKRLSGLSSEERLKQRQLVVKPLVDSFFLYLKQNEDKISKHVDDKDKDFLGVLLPWPETLPEHIRKPKTSADK